MPTDESCYDEVVEATGSDTCEFTESPEKFSQKRGKWWRDTFLIVRMLLQLGGVCTSKFLFAYLFA